MMSTSQLYDFERERQKANLFHHFIKNHVFSFLCDILEIINNKKIEVVGPVDNRLSTDNFHQFLKNTTTTKT